MEEINNSLNKSDSTPNLNIANSDQKLVISNRIAAPIKSSQTNFINLLSEADAQIKEDIDDKSLSTNISLDKQIRKQRERKQYVRKAQKKSPSAKKEKKSLNKLRKIEKKQEDFLKDMDSKEESIKKDIFEYIKSNNVDFKDQLLKDWSEILEKIEKEEIEFMEKTKNDLLDNQDSYILDKIVKTKIVNNLSEKNNYFFENLKIVKKNKIVNLISYIKEFITNLINSYNNEYNKKIQILYNNDNNNINESKKIYEELNTKINDLDNRKLFNVSNRLMKIETHINNINFKTNTNEDDNNINYKINKNIKDWQNNQLNSIIQNVKNEMQDNFNNKIEEIKSDYNNKINEIKNYYNSEIDSLKRKFDNKNENDKKINENLENLINKNQKENNDKNSKLIETISNNYNELNDKIKENKNIYEKENINIKNIIDKKEKEINLTINKNNSDVKDNINDLIKELNDKVSNNEKKINNINNQIDNVKDNHELLNKKVNETILNEKDKFNKNNETLKNELNNEWDKKLNKKLDEYDSNFKKEMENNNIIMKERQNDINNLTNEFNKLMINNNSSTKSNKIEFETNVIISIKDDIISLKNAEKNNNLKIELIKKDINKNQEDIIELNKNINNLEKNNEQDNKNHNNLFKDLNNNLNIMNKNLLNEISKESNEINKKINNEIFDLNNKIDSIKKNQNDQSDNINNKLNINIDNMNSRINYLNNNQTLISQKLENINNEILILKTPKNDKSKSKDEKRNQNKSKDKDNNSKNNKNINNIISNNKLNINNNNKNNIKIDNKNKNMEDGFNCCEFCDNYVSKSQRDILNLINEIKYVKNDIKDIFDKLNNIKNEEFDDINYENFNEKIKDIDKEIEELKSNNILVNKKYIEEINTYKVEIDKNIESKLNNFKKRFIALQKDYNKNNNDLNLNNNNNVIEYNSITNYFNKYLAEFKNLTEFKQFLVNNNKENYELNNNIEKKTNTYKDNLNYMNPEDEIIYKSEHNQENINMEIKITNSIENKRKIDIINFILIKKRKLDENRTKIYSEKLFEIKVFNDSKFELNKDYDDCNIIINDIKNKSNSAKICMFCYKKNHNGKDCLKFNYIYNCSINDNILSNKYFCKKCKDIHNENELCKKFYIIYIIHILTNIEKIKDKENLSKLILEKNILYNKRNCLSFSEYNNKYKKEIIQLCNNINIDLDDRNWLEDIKFKIMNKDKNNKIKAINNYINENSKASYFKLKKRIITLENQNLINTIENDIWKFKAIKELSNNNINKLDENLNMTPDDNWRREKLRKIKNKIISIRKGWSLEEKIKKELQTINNTKNSDSYIEGRIREYEKKLNKKYEKIKFNNIPKIRKGNKIFIYNIEYINVKYDNNIININSNKIEIVNMNNNKKNENQEDNWDGYFNESESGEEANSVSEQMQMENNNDNMINNSLNINNSNLSLNSNLKWNNQQLKNINLVNSNNNVNYNNNFLNNSNANNEINNQVVKDNIDMDERNALNCTQEKMMKNSKNNNNDKNDEDEDEK